MKEMRSEGTERDGGQEPARPGSLELELAAELVQQGRKANRLAQVMIVVAVLTLIATCLSLLL